jgi:ADP-dependent NAD(P)H-hydrate dehydratase / NAD(P)H-hydrate epimerase
MKIVSAAEMRAIDHATSERFGVPSLTLMENAGSAVTKHVLARYGAAQKIVVFCGKGNNGGDGFVAARLLHQAGKTVQVILLADRVDLHGDASEMFGRLPMPAIVVHSREDLNSEHVRLSLSADLYLDAILGTGFRPPVQGLYAEAIAILNAGQVPVVAVDIPSGADADAMSPQTGTVAKADSVVSFTAPRPAHVFGSLSPGPTCIANIGSPAEAITSSLQLNVITTRDFARLIGPRPAESNKGKYGHVLVAGGSVGKAGSVAMAGISALRTGCGLATVATPKSALSTVAGFYPELMTESLTETSEGTLATSAINGLNALLKGKNVLAIGPGISRNPETSDLVRSLVRTLASSGDIPVVLDADGLNAFEGRSNELSGKGRVLVITPHPGEMARLAACSIADVQKDRLGVARRFAREHNVMVVLKGHRTLVVQPDGEAWVNTTGNPGMSTGGTGDILTGMVSAMIAQHPNDVLLAVCAAVHLHGLAADVMRGIVGEHSMLATDLLQGLPDAFRRAEQTSREEFVCWDG